MNEKSILKEELVRIVKSSIHDGSVNIIDFLNHYTAVLASACPVGVDVNIYSPVVENIRNYGCEEWCESKGYLYHPVHISLEEAKTVALSNNEFSLI